VLTVGIKRLPFDFSRLEPRAQCRRDLLLKGASPPPQVNDRREPFAREKSDDVNS
jgi:hypothetical protein